MTVLHEHTHPHCFKFVRGGIDGSSQMFYRKWTGDPWMGPVSVLKVIKTRCMMMFERRHELYNYHTVARYGIFLSPSCLL